MNKKKKTILLLISTLILTLAVTYSWFASFYAVQNIAGEFYYQLDVTITESTGNIITLEKALPMETNDALNLVVPHEFTVSTTGDVMIDYYVIVRDITNIDPNNVVAAINPTNIYYGINTSASPGYVFQKLEPNVSKRHRVLIGSLPANGSHEISIRLFLGPQSVVEGGASETDPATGIRTYRYFTAQIIVEVD